MENKKSFCRSQKGQAILETAAVYIILMVLVFGIIDIARLGFVLMHLRGAASVAGRAAAVRKQPWEITLAVEYIMLRTETKSGLLSPFAGNSEYDVAGSQAAPGFGGSIGDGFLKGIGWKPLDGSDKIKAAKGNLYYEFFPVFTRPVSYSVSAAALKAAWVYPIKVPYRTVVETPDRAPY